MSIWGKIVGASVGFALGGPLGALAGAAAGHYIGRFRADAIAAEGIGGSASFLIALLKGLSLLNSRELENLEIARLASNIEINKLNKI